jgi:hypothetical protein
MRESDTDIVPLRCGTPLLPPSSVAGKETAVPAIEGCPTITESKTVATAILTKAFPSNREEQQVQANQGDLPTPGGVDSAKHTRDHAIVP